MSDTDVGQIVTAVNNLEEKIIDLHGRISNIEGQMAGKAAASGMTGGVITGIIVAITGAIINLLVNHKLP